MVRAEEALTEARDDRSKRRSKRLRTKRSLQGSTFSISAPSRSSRQRTPSPTSSNDTMDSQDAIVCDCKDGLSPDRESYIICTRCVKMQHSDCSNREVGDGQDPRSFRCNKCEEAELLHAIKSRQEEYQRIQGLIAQKRADAEALYMKVLWRSYCILPNGNASEAVIEATRTKYDEGKTVPVHEAPQSWVEEVRKKVKEMMDAVGKEATDFVLRPDYPSMNSDESLLMAWREIAVKLLHHGAYKGRRQALGALAEILGLEEIGTFWKGEQEVVQAEYSLEQGLVQSH